MPTITLDTVRKTPIKGTTPLKTSTINETIRILNAYTWNHIDINSLEALKIEDKNVLTFSLKSNKIENFNASENIKETNDELNHFFDLVINQENLKNIKLQIGLTMSNIQNISSEGLGILIRLNMRHMKIYGSNNPLYLIDTSNTINKIFELSQLKSLFKFVS